MPRATTVDWEQAKALYLQGLKSAEICKRVGCNASSLRSRSYREQWASLAAKTSELMQAEPDIDVKEYGREHVQTVLRTVKKRLEHLNKISPEDLSISELRELAACTEIWDKMARRACDLDDSASSKVSITNVTLSLTRVDSAIALPQSAQVIDAQPIED